MIRTGMATSSIISPSGYPDPSPRSWWERQPAFGHRRKLEAQALARAGRHHADHVISCKHVLDDFALARPEPLQSEDRLQDLIDGFHVGEAPM
jgi:hypothetical protein